MWKLLPAIVVSGMLAVQLFAQAPPEPAFEVASVKPNKSGSGDVHFGIEGDRFTADNTPLKELIRATYQVRDLQIIDAPDWIESERFNIVAKASAQLKPGVPPPELKQLMADRFGLRVHNETRSQERCAGNSAAAGAAHWSAA